MGVTPIYSIPFAEPTDLVRDWPELSEDVADAVEAAIAGVPVLAGIGSNVVQTVKTDTFTSNSSTFEEVDGLSATITPTSDSSLVLVLMDVKLGSGEEDGIARIRMVRDSTAIYVGSTADAVTFANPFSNTTASRTLRGFTIAASTAVFLDSPNTDSPVTYKCQINRSSGTAYVNRTDDGGARTASSITLIEVAA